MPRAPHVNLEPSEYELHHIVPVSWQPGTKKKLVAPEKVRLTPDQHVDTHVYIDLLVVFKGKRLPWAVRRRFGKGTRDRAQDGYDRAIKLGLTPKLTR